MTDRERDVEIGKEILLSVAAEGAIDNFDEKDFLKVTEVARRLLRQPTAKGKENK